jgi:hypothetical protein
MDFEKFLNFATSNLSNYLYILITTISNPLSFFKTEIPSESKDKKIIITIHNENNIKQKAQLSSKLITYTLISIFLGLTIHTQIPKSSKRGFPRIYVR